MATSSRSPDDLDDLVSIVENEGLDLSLEGKLPSERRPSADSEFDIGDEQDSAKVALDNSNDPVRLYLREMGSVRKLRHSSRARRLRAFVKRDNEDNQEQQLWPTAGARSISDRPVSIKHR